MPKSENYSIDIVNSKLYECDKCNHNNRIAIDKYTYRYFYCTSCGNKIYLNV